MNIQSALGFPFKDSNWVMKILIGGGLSFVALLPMAWALLAGENVFVQIVTYLLFFGLIALFLALRVLLPDLESKQGKSLLFRME